MKNNQEQEIKFQIQCERFVRNEVIYTQGTLIEMLVRKGDCGDKEISEAGYTIDNIENLYIPTCTNCGHSQVDALDESPCKVCDHGIFRSDEPQEILEWWIITDYLAGKLKELGEPILDTDNGVYWGRCTSGQAISIDGVIRNIVKSL